MTRGVLIYNIKFKYFNNIKIYNFFSMDPSPFSRNTFWSVTIGLSIAWLSNLAVHPGAIQRFTAVPKYKDAER